MIFGKPLRDISAEDIADLVESRTAEEVQLDYKREWWKNDKEQLKDVCAFANAQGGYIVIGVEEKGNSPTGILALPEGEVQKDALIKRCMAQIKPAIRGLDGAVILMPEHGGNAIVIHVPNSFHGPHMVDCKRRGYYFPMRIGTDTVEMTIAQIHEVCVRNESLRRQSKEKLSRLTRLEVHMMDREHPRLLIACSPTISFDGVLDIHAHEFVKVLLSTPPFWPNEENPFRKLDHAVWMRQITMIRKANAFGVFHLHHDGSLQYSVSFEPSGSSLKGHSFLPSVSIINNVGTFIRLARDTVSRRLLSTPMYWACSVENIANPPVPNYSGHEGEAMHAALVNAGNSWQSPFNQRGEFSYESPCGAAVGEIIKSVLDRLWRVLGAQECDFVDSTGKPIIM